MDAAGPPSKTGPSWEIRRSEDRRYNYFGRSGHHATQLPEHPEASMEPWYTVTTARAEVREGRSFNPDEIAIEFEQVVVMDGGRHHHHGRLMIHEA
jgi:hypothetical protein